MQYDPNPGQQGGRRFDDDARLNAESRSAGQPKSSLVRQALEQFLSRRKRERFLAGLTQAARALDPGEALEVAADVLSNET